MHVLLALWHDWVVYGWHRVKATIADALHDDGDVSGWGTGR